MEDKAILSENMSNSIMKNIGELSDFCVYDFNVYNYYDFINKIIFLNNMLAKLKERDIELFNSLCSDIKKKEERMKNNV